MEVLTSRQHAGFDGASIAVGAARQGNRRRLMVFLGVLSVSLLVGQAWNFARTDIYVASSRLKIILPDVGSTGAAPTNLQANQVQKLTSRALLRQAANAMAAAGQPLPQDGEDPALHLQSMLRVRPTPGTDVLALEAVGEVPAQLVALLNSLPDVVRSEVVASQAQAADAQVDDARKELAQLERTAAQRRGQLERFRSAAGVQAERDENEVVSRSKGLMAALNTAVEKEAAADARVRALADAAAKSRPGMGARDDPTLTGMEARASQAREELRDMERSYTPDFMAMDPRARALRARLTELEQQIAQQRVAGQQAALQGAQQDLLAARATVEHLRSQQAQVRPDLHGASVRIAQAKLMEDDLAQVEKARRDLIERVARLDADSRRRIPVVEVLEPAALPTAPIAPNRVRDGLWVLGGSLVLAVLAMALVELFNRSPASAFPGRGTTVVMPVPWRSSDLTLPGAPPASRPGLEASADPRPLLVAPAPGVLQQAEAAALLAAAQGMTRFAVAAALMGLNEVELLSLRACDLDIAALRLKVPGPWPRELPMPAWLAQALPSAASDDRAPLLRDATGLPLAEADLQTMFACAAVDAGLPQGATLDAARLRNTFIAWLLGQGLRFSDLPALVGRVDPGLVAAFSGHAAGVHRRPMAEVGLLMPALQLAPLP